MAAPAPKLRFDEDLLRALLHQRAELESQVFAAPPKDWPEFMFRMGAWVQTNTLIQAQEALARERNQEDDES